MKYNLNIVLAFFNSEGLPTPIPEYVFHPTRRWRFDFAWTGEKLALECQGGIWTHGRHNRGAALLKEWEKLNNATMQGWRILYVQPSDLCLTHTVNMVRESLLV